MLKCVDGRANVNITVDEEKGCLLVAVVAFHFSGCEELMETI